MESQDSPVSVFHDAFVRIISEHQEFAIDFDEAWQWMGYSSKHKALEMLEKNFVEGVEFSPVGVKTSGEKGGRPASHIMLSVDCFKAFCMLAQTERGREVRLYYIQLEKEVALMGSAAGRRIDPVVERRELLAAITNDQKLLRGLTITLEESPTYREWVEVTARLAKNRRMLKGINDSTVEQLNLWAESADII